MMVGLIVYADFLSYYTGIYSHVSGAYLGGHAIKLIGWGTSGSTLYWICQNQWTEYWGD